MRQLRPKPARPARMAKPPEPLLRSSSPSTLSLDIIDEMVQIKVEGFDGPLDLLLDLIEHEKLDITALSLAEITDQYWREIESPGALAQTGNRLLDPEALAEFIAIGSKLLYIKSAALVNGSRPS